MTDIAMQHGVSPRAVFTLADAFILTMRKEASALSLAL